MLKKKSFIALALAGTLMASAFAGCGSGGGGSASEGGGSSTGSSGTASESSAAASGSTGGKQTLRVAWWGNTERDKLYYAINDMFVKENPDVEIVTESPGWNDYWVKMATAYASDSAADVVQFQSNQIGEYCSKDVLMPLEPYVESGAINLDNWNMDFVNTGKYQDKLYVVTLGMTAQAMFVNETLLKNIGVDLWGFEEDISWTDFEAFLNDVQSKLPADTYSCNDIYTNNDLVWVWIRQHGTTGTEWVNAEGKFAPTLQTMTDWYALSERLRQSGAFAPVTWTQEWNAKAWQEGALVSGKAAILFDNANKYKMYQNASEDNLVLRKVPTNEGGENLHGDLLITSAYGISKTSQNPDLAAKYIDFFVNNMEAQKTFNMELGVPGSLTVQEELNKTADPSDVAATEYLNMIAKDAPPFIAKAPGVWAIQDEISKTAEIVATGGMTPEQAADHITTVANDVIAENAES